MKKPSFSFLGRLHSRPDRWLTIGVIVLSLFGVLMVFDSSAAIAIRDFSDQFHFAREQFRWLIIGLIGFGVASFIPYKFWYKLALPGLLLTLLLLVMVFVPGIGVHALGARRWIDFGLFILQPAELAKLKQEDPWMYVMASSGVALST